MNTHLFGRLAVVLGVATFLSASALPVAAQIIAYDVPAGAVGNQGFGGSLGMDFNVGLTPVQVTRLGAFDSGSDGLANPIGVRLYDRAPFEAGGAATELLNEIVAAGPAGTLIGGSRFITPSSLITLPAGFHGTIVADSYSAAEPLYNAGIPGGGPGSITNNGAGALQFVGTSRFGLNPGTYPDVTDAGPANRYNAGTFEYQPIGPTVHMAYSDTELIGNQDYSGTLGMDFDVGANPISVTHLGAFDSGRDGIAGLIELWIFNRDDGSILAGPFALDSSNDDLLVNSDRWIDLADFTLPADFHGVIGARGFGPNDLNFNSQGGVSSSILDDGDGAITFTGSARFGDVGAADPFPASPDGGPANRYGAGTFAFVVVPEPSTALRLALGLSLYAVRRRR